MKRIIFALLLLSLCVNCFAASVGTIETDNNGVYVQGGSPNGTLSQILTVNSVVISNATTPWLWWKIYTPNACKYRIMTTSAKGSYPQFTLLAGERLSSNVNKLTPYVNFSGCTNAELSGQ